jgi:hypothetical protein
MAPASLSAPATRTARGATTHTPGSSNLPTGKATAPRGADLPASEVIGPTRRTAPRADRGSRPSAPDVPASQSAAPPERPPEVRPRQRPAKNLPEPSTPLAAGKPAVAAEPARASKQSIDGKPPAAPPEQKQRRTKPSALAAKETLSLAPQNQPARPGARTKPISTQHEHAGGRSPDHSSNGSGPQTEAPPSGSNPAARRSSDPSGTPPARTAARAPSVPKVAASVPVPTPTVTKRSAGRTGSPEPLKEGTSGTAGIRSSTSPTGLAQEGPPTAKTAIRPPAGPERKRPSQPEAQQTLALEIGPAAAPTRRSKSPAAPAIDPTAQPEAVGPPDQPSKPASRRRSAPLQEPAPQIPRARR